MGVFVSVGGNQTMVGVTVAVAVGSGGSVDIGAGREPEQAVSAASRLALNVIEAIRAAP
jgi:hypothetical protein